MKRYQDIIKHWRELAEPHHGDFENFKNEYQVQRINALIDALRGAIDLLENFWPEKENSVWFSPEFNTTSRD